MTLTQSSRFASLTIGAAAIVAVAFSAATAAPAFAASVCPGTTFSTNLKLGSKGAAVMDLQKFLNMSADTQIAATGAGSPGNESTYFGALTKAAVNKFQVKYAAQILTPNGLTTPTGNFYAASRNQANAVCAGSTGSTTGGTTTGGTAAGTATVAAAAQPANTLAPANAARVPFTAFTVTAGGAPVTLNSVSVTRQGPSLDTDFAGVVLIDASTGVQIGNSRVLDSNHSATIGSAITIPAGSSKTFWVAGNIAAAPGAGNIASFAVTAVNTASSVTGSFPIVGASNTMNANLAIGSATIQPSSFDPASASTQPIGTTGYRFSGLRIQAGSQEDVTFKSITWYQSGSASGLQNIMTVVNGTSYPTVADATGRYFTTVLPSGITIAKGQSVDVYVTADLGANTTANTTAEFDVYRNTDVYVVGNTYGFGITPGGSAFGSGSIAATPHVTKFFGGTNQPFFQGSAVTVTAGTFSTIQNATSVGAQNIAVNVANQPLGGFQTNLTGEAITAQTLRVNFTFTSGSSSAALTNISLVNESGSVVAGPFDAVVDSGTTQHVIFSGSILFPTGTHTYTIKGQVPTTAVNGATIVASTDPSTQWGNVTGNTTGNNVTPAVTTFNMNTMTVKAATLAISNSTSPTSQTVVAGGSNVLFANIQLDASQSGEDVRLSSVPVTIGGTGTAANLSNCQIWDGTTALNTGSRVINSANISGTTGSYTATFSFDNSLTIPKGTVKTLGITCNVASGASGTYQFGSAAAGSYSVTGSVSGATVTPSAVTGTAPTMTISTGGNLAVSTDASSPSAALVAGGTTGVTANVIKFRASNEAVNLQKVALKLTSGAATDLTQVYLYAGNNVMTTTGTAIPANTLLGTATFTGGTNTATSTLTSTIQLPKDTDATIIVKADTADVGSNQPGIDMDNVVIDYNNSQGTGNNSGATVYGTVGVTTNAAGIRLFNTIPTVASDATLPSTGVADGRLAEFKISADSHGPVGISKITFVTTWTTISGITNATLNVYSDAGYNNLVTSGNYGTTTGQLGFIIPTLSSGTPYSFSAATNQLQIPAGSTYYFKLTGTVAGATSGASAVTTLKGDASFDGPKQASAVSGNFVWSDNATTTANLSSDNDWANGNSVSGLPASGLLQTRSN